MSTLEQLAVLHALPWPLAVCLLVAAALLLGHVAAPGWAWAATAVLLLVALGAPGWTLAAAAGLVAVLLVVPLRRSVLSAPVLALLRRLEVLPRISDTERVAIEAGTVWLDGDLFSGRPDLRRLLAEPWPELTPREREFLEGPVEEVCRMTNDWDVMQRRDLPPETWDFLARERFFGMIIPEEHGGLGFSAAAHSEVIARLASRSQALAITVMVPNSLGPAELLLAHGTPEQARRWLPALARGEEIPCFALTEPGAGSDAAAIQAHGDVFRRDDGELALRLHWDKRYITLAAVSTVLGVAFRARDPDELLGLGPEPGLTCALVPADTPGVRLGRRHDPLGVPFYNCPTTGRDVVVPLDAVIGGRAGVGAGWRMLMESLAAGRGISLPAAATGTTKLAARVAGAHAAVRKQFGAPIGRFGGVQEPLARLAGTAWLLEAVRRTTCGAIDSGARPAVVSAIAKLASTELCRGAIADAMDVLAGNGISRGPSNLLATAHAGAPIMITVEGANILTRTLMVFGQGAIRCHPHLQREVAAVESGDVRAFDRALWAHAGHAVGIACRALVLSASRGLLARVPLRGPAARQARRLCWAAALFAALAELSLLVHGGRLKRMEKLTGRHADAFTWLYLCACALRRFEAEGSREEDEPLLEWCFAEGLHRIQEAFEGITTNFGGGPIGLLLRFAAAPALRLAPLSTGPRDRLVGRLASILQAPGPQRERITGGLHLPASTDEPLGRLELALATCTKAIPLERRLRQASRAGRLDRTESGATKLERAVAEGVLSESEADVLREAEALRERVIQVDSFTLEEYARSAVRTAPPVARGRPGSDAVRPAEREDAGPPRGGPAGAGRGRSR